MSALVRAVYAIRHQFAGIVTERLYTRLPTEEQLAAARERCGAAGWARPVALALEVGDVEVQSGARLGDYFDAFPEPEPELPATQGFPGIRFRATGVITPPSG